MKKIKFEIIILFLTAGLLSACGGRINKSNIENVLADSAEQSIEAVQSETVSDNEVVRETSTVVAEVVQEEAAAAKTGKLPVAVNPDPENVITEMDKDVYFQKIDAVWETGAKDGKLAIPSMGILFLTGKSDVLPYYEEMLAEFIALYKETDGTAKILIEGYSSNGGKETVRNPELSADRAKAVAKILKKNKIPKENMILKAYSNKKLTSRMFDGDPGCQGGGCYRRVNISIR